MNFKVKLDLKMNLKLKLKMKTKLKLKLKLSKTKFGFDQIEIKACYLHNVFFRPLPHLIKLLLSIVYKSCYQLFLLAH